MAVTPAINPDAQLMAILQQEQQQNALKTQQAEQAAKASMPIAGFYDITPQDPAPAASDPAMINLSHMGGDVPNSPGVAEFINYRWGQMIPGVGHRASMDISSVDPATLIPQDAYSRIRQIKEGAPDKWDTLDQAFLGGASGGGMAFGSEGTIVDMFQQDMIPALDALQSGQEVYTETLPTGERKLTLPKRQDFNPDGTVKGFFSDPRIIAAMASAVMAMAAGVKPSDALLWGAVGAGEAEKSLAATHKASVDEAMQQAEFGLEGEKVDATKVKANASAKTADVKANELEYKKLVDKWKLPKEMQVAVGNMRANFIKSQAAKQLAALHGAQYASDLVKDAQEYALKRQKTRSDMSAKTNMLGTSAVDWDVNTFNDDVNQYLNLATGTGGGKEFLPVNDDAPKQAVDEVTRIMGQYQAGNAAQRNKFKVRLKDEVTAGNMTPQQYKEWVKRLAEIDNQE